MDGDVESLADQRQGISMIPVYASANSGMATVQKFQVTNLSKTHRWCLHLTVVVGFECSWDPESYAGGSSYW
jgi:hypothetical protein